VLKNIIVAPHDLGNCCDQSQSRVGGVSLV
jgi:hypothetical protein